MIIPETNAFTINRLGAAFFPLSLDVSKKGDVISAFFCAQRVVDICDQIEKYATDNLVLFNVGQVSLYDEREERPFSLEKIAASAAVPYSAIDSETILLQKGKLKSFLSTFDHYSLFALDIGNQWREAEVISQVITCKEHDWRTEEFVLPKLLASRLLVLSHDDCYLTVQTYSMAFVKQIFARVLQIYTGTVLAESGETRIDVAEVPDDVLDSFWDENFGLTILRETTEIKPQALKIGVTKKPLIFERMQATCPSFGLDMKPKASNGASRNNLLEIEW